MRKALTVLTAAILAAAAVAPAAAQTKAPTTREMALLCWQEFGELVPARIRTVLVPFGSLEPHGVIPNGTDSLAPEAMARDIAARVDALIAPTLNYGDDRGHEGLSGGRLHPGRGLRAVRRGRPRQPGRAGLQEPHRPQRARRQHGRPQRGRDQGRQRPPRPGPGRQLVDAGRRHHQGRVQAERRPRRQQRDGLRPGLPASSTSTPSATSPRWPSPTPRPGAYTPSRSPRPSSSTRRARAIPTFDAAQAKEYFRKVNDRVAELVLDTVRKWDAAGVYE
ncbi:MAG: creatininase family protein [Desulfobacterales bacterium]|nr:creatininase family protein [Desulfobacterales bacterium]